jgi:ribonuclease HI
MKSSAANVNRWTRPDPRYLKLNVDSSFNLEEMSRAAGAVLGDYEGKFRDASCTIIPHVPSAEMSESIVVREGLKLAEQSDCSRIIVESDSLETIQALTGEQRWWSSSVAIYADCVDFVSRIGQVSFRFCPREGNQVAHELARYSFSKNISCNWTDDPLAFS